MPKIKRLIVDGANAIMAFGNQEEFDKALELLYSDSELVDVPINLGVPRLLIVPNKRTDQLKERGFEFD